jgi:hypothetical protein
MRNHAAAMAMAALLLASRDGFAAESFETVCERMTRFYLTPTQGEFEAIQRGIKSHLKQFKAAEEENGTATLAEVFLARVNAKYHYPLLDIGNFDDMAKSIAAKDGTDFSNYVDDDTRVDPSKIDIWWISYFATTDPHYLENILAQVANVKTQSSVAQKMVAHAASWSLASNCEQHPAVLEYVRSVLARTPPPTNADALQEVLARVGRHDG